MALTKVSGKNIPYLISKEIKQIYSRNPKNYFKCNHCCRTTYFENNQCVSCNKIKEEI